MSRLTPFSVLITGANRGLGLELVTQFIGLPKPPSAIFVTYRKEEASKKLLELAKQHSFVHALKFDVTDYSALGGLTEYVDKVVEDKGLTLLINNAGVIDRGGLEDTTPEAMREVYEINVVAPLMLTQALLPLLRRAAATGPEGGLNCSRAAIMNMSTKLASVADNASGTRYPYRASKAALNITSKSMAVELERDGILVLMLHPGWVQTDMTGPNALITPQSSVKGMMQVLAGADSQLNGAFIDFQGKHIPW